MATELAAGYVSLTVKMAKGGMADVTKEVKKAGQEGGKAYGDEFGKQVEKDVAKKLPDAVGKATKSGGGGGGFGKAAKEAAEEFGKGILEGIEKELGGSGGVSDAIEKATKSSGGPGLGKAAKEAAKEFGKGFKEGVKDALTGGDIDGTLDNVNKKVKQTTDLIKEIGGATGIDTTGVVNASKTISDAIGGISESVGSTKTALDAFKTGDIAGGLQGTVDALKGLENIGLPEGFATEVGTLADNFDKVSKQIDPVTGGLKGIAELAPGSGLDKFAEKIGLIGDAMKLIIALQPELAKIDNWIASHTNLPLNQTPLEGLRNVVNDINAAHPGSPRFGGTPGGPQPSQPYVPGGPHRAGGGSISGPGGPKSDIIPIWASSGEHVLTAADVAKMGGQANVYKFRSMLQGFAGGGAVDNPDVLAAMGLVGTPYSQSARNDCSGTVAQVINSVLGMSGSGLMSTKTAQSWLAARGFIPGRGGPGQISVGWYDHGPNPNDGHMAMTLSNGQPAESGGSHGSFLVGAGAKGADSPQFDQHMYLPTVFGEGPGSSGGPSSSSAGGGGGAGGGTPALSDNPMRALQQIGEQQQALDMQKGEQIKKLLPDFGALADIGAGGLKETFLPPGFSDPTQWKSVKSIGALLGWLGGISGDPATASIMGGIGAGITGSGSGLVSGIMGAIPQPFGNLAPTADQFGANNAYAPGAQAVGLPPGALPPGISVGTINDNSGQAVSDLQKTERFNTMGQAMALRNMVRG